MLKLIVANLRIYLLLHIILFRGRTEIFCNRMLLEVFSLTKKFSLYYYVCVSIQADQQNLNDTVCPEKVFHPNS